MGRCLHIFNPEHDFALAVGSATYTSPSKVNKLRENLALLPAVIAGNSDFILIPDSLDNASLENLTYYNLAVKKNLRMIHLKDIWKIEKDINEIKPWGWNHVLKNSLLKAGIDSHILPSDTELDYIRNLSHRRITIPFSLKVYEILNQPTNYLPKEIFSLQEVEEFLRIYPLSFFKAPWSSSGRGITLSSHISHKGLLEWCHGILRKQGSIIAEPAWDKKMDFASEWWISNGKAEYIGPSVFEASTRGKYHGNVDADILSLNKMIIEKVPNFNDIIEAQQAVLQSLIAPFYSGPIGVDMLVDKDNNVNCCVEINLRLTMGLIQLLKNYEI